VLVAATGARLRIDAVAGEARDPAAARLAARVLDAAGLKGGLVVHVDCGDGKLTAALRRSESFIVHGLVTDSKSLAAARKHIASRGVYGPVSADGFDGRRLPYAGNIVNLIVIPKGSTVPGKELRRVLAPGGTAVELGGEGGTEPGVKFRKPRPKSIDEWTHYLHGPDNNAVAEDAVVGPPRRMQWTASPRWARHHDRMASTSAMVSAGGRVFYIVDEGSRASVQLPPRWRLVARDAFSGVLLWKRKIPDWFFHLWPMKGGPAQLPRRLVAVGDRVYVTLGLRAPVSELDAATGRTLRSFPQTARTEELLVSGELLLALVNPKAGGEKPFVPDRSGVWNDTGRVQKEYAWDRQKSRRLVALSLDSGKPTWKRDDDVAPLSPALDGKRAYYHDGESVVALDRASGRKLWRSVSTGRRRTFNHAYAPTLVVYRDVVIFAGLDNKMTAFAAGDGKKLWTAPHPPSGHLSPRDVLVTGGLVWSGAIANTRNSGVFTGRAPRSGKVVREFGPDVKTYWFHHRCYRSKATSRYLLPSRTGIEFVDFHKKHWDVNHWVRGGCIYGIMPANGLVYTPPHSCACYLETKLNGVNALAPAAKIAGGEGSRPKGLRLEKGPAYDRVSGSGLRVPGGEDWPTYRHDAARSGAASTAVGGELKESWAARIGGRLSSVTVAGGLAFVTQVDAHALHALDAASGERKWRFTAGGRVDSPPTIRGGRVCFGSADGYVYCLRAEDGALAWRFRAAPAERLVVNDGRLESAWPLHGSVLLRENVIHAVAGRSAFLDGGLNLCRLEAGSGKLLSEHRLDSRDPRTGRDLHSKVKVLNMPVGLPDVLSCDGKNIYMRSQRFDLQLRRAEATPQPTDPVQLARFQKGEGRHLFCPGGFLDGSWFHRSYWIYGRSYSSGCNWWAAAQRFTPTANMLVVDRSTVWGYGRKPRYHGRWSVPLGYHLFACPRDPEVSGTLSGPKRTHVLALESRKLLPKGKPVSLSVWVRAGAPDGVVLSNGGKLNGYSLVLRAGKPALLVSSGEKHFSAASKTAVGDGWTHLAAVLSAGKRLKLYVNGELKADVAGPGPLKENPRHKRLAMGTDIGSVVGGYAGSPYFKGTVDEARVYHRELSAGEVRLLAAGPGKKVARKGLVLHYSFDGGEARDSSGLENHGLVFGKPEEGRFGGGMAFEGPPEGLESGSLKPYRKLTYSWSRDFPVHVRAMLLAGKVLFAAGPDYVLDEEAAYRKPHSREVRARLAEQDLLYSGEKGARLVAVDAGSGKKLGELRLPAIPVWDGMAAAGGRLYVATADGSLTCFAPAKAPKAPKGPKDSGGE
jgi:outer membrane protein assembly factor BamB